MAGLNYDVGDSGRRIVVGISARVARLEALNGIMPELAGVVYETTKIWFDSNGEGTWPRLAESTIAKKASQGLADPARPLYAHGNLYESVTSPSGPYSYMIPMWDGVVVGVWWTAAKALATGTRTSGSSGHTVIPARPIWPPVTSALGLEMKHKIGQFIMAWVEGRGTPAFPGARMARLPAGSPGSTGGQFTPLLRGNG